MKKITGKTRLCIQDQCFDIENSRNIGGKHFRLSNLDLFLSNIRGNNSLQRNNIFRKHLSSGDGTRIVKFVQKNRKIINN